MHAFPRLLNAGFKPCLPSLALVALVAAAPSNAAITSQVTFGFSKYDGSLGNGDPYSATIEADGSTDQMTFSDWRIDEFDASDYGVNMNNGGPSSVFADPASDNFQFVSFTTEVFCGTSWTFDVVGYKDGSPVSGDSQTFTLGGVGGPTVRTVNFASVDEVRFENYTTDNGSQCVVIDDIVLDQEVVSNTQPEFTALDATINYDEAAGSPVVIDSDATVSDTELDGAGDYAGSTLTVERSGGATTDDAFGFDTSAGTFSVSGSDLLTGGNIFASFTESGGTLTVNFNSSAATATPALADDVLQAVTYANTADPEVVEYNLTLTFNDGDPGGALEVSNSRPTVFDPDLAPVSTSTTIDFSTLEPKLANGDRVDARIVQELLFYGFDFEDASEDGTIVSSGLQLEGATSDPASTANRFTNDSTFLLDSIGIENFSTNAQDVTVHGYRGGSLQSSETISFGAESGRQTFDMDALNSVFLSVDEVRFTVSDNGFVAIDDVVVDVSNQSPTLDLDTGAAGSDHTVTFSENAHQGTATTDGVAVAGAVAASDADGTIETVTLTLDNSQGDAGETLSIDTAPLSASLGFSVSANQITIVRNTASNADLVAAVEAVRYLNNSDTPNTTSRTVTVEVTDDQGATASATGTISVEAGNDAPTVTAPGGTLQPTEDVSFDLNGANEIQIADVDAGVGTVEVSLSANNGTLTLGSTTGLAVDSGSNGSAALTVSGAVADLNNALATLSYLGNADYFGADTISVTVNDRGNTGTDPGNTGDGSSEADSTSVSLDVQAVDDAPTITAIVDQTTDEDTTLSGVAFTVDDAETAAGSLTVSFSVDNPSLVDSHTFGGTGASRTLEIVPAANENGTATVTVTVSDGSLTAQESFVLTVNAVNDLPTVTPAINTLDTTVDEDAAVPSISLTVDDVESGGAGVTVTASSDNQALVPDANLSVTDNGGGDRTLDATLAADENGTATITVTLNDGTDTVSDNFTLTVNPVNDAPEITNSPSGTVTVLEGQAYSYTPTVDDPDASDTTSFSIAGGPAWMNFDTATGELSGTPTNAEVGTYSGIEITVTDSAGATDATETFSIEVVDVNQPPVIGNLDGDTGSVVAGGGTVAIDAAGDATLSNPDSDDNDGGYLFIQQDTGTANGNFAVDGTNVTANGDASIAAGETVAVGGVAIGTVHGTNDGQGGIALELSLNANATNARVQTLIRELTYSAPSGLGMRTFTLTISDGDGNANGGDPDSQVGFSIDVTPNPPVIGGVDGDTVTFTEGDGSVLLDADQNATLTDPDSTDFDGGTLTLDIVAGDQANDILSLDTSGTVTLSGTGTAGDTVSVGGTAVGTLANNIAAGNALVINMGAGATPARMQEVARALQYENSAGDDPVAGDRTVRLTISDAGTSAATSSDNDVVLTVVSVNDAPTVTIGADQAVDEDSGVQTVAGFATGFDPVESGQALDQYLVTNDNNSLFSAQPAIDNAGALTYTPAANAAGVATVSVRARDDGGTTNGGSDTSAIQTFTITLNNLNDAPVLSGTPSSSVAEDSAYQYTPSVTDPDSGEVLSFSIVGKPSWASFNATTGALSGTPSDSDVGSYTGIEITVSDDEGASDSTGVFSISVSGVNDAPVARDDSGLSVEEDSVDNVLSVLANDSDQDSSIDASSLTIVTPAEHGQVTVDSGSVLYTPEADFNGADAFSYTVADSQGAVSNEAIVTLDVSAVNDAPEFVSSPPALAEPDEVLTYDVVVEDVDGDALTITADGLPTWLSFTDRGDGTAIVEGTPGADQSGQYSFTLTATDAGGAQAQQAAAVTVVPADNQAPEFVSSPEEKAFSTFSYRYEVRAEDAAGQQISLRAVSKPGWLSFVDNGEGEGVLMGTPADADIGRPRIVLEASDEFGASQTQSYDLQVLSGDEATVSAELTVSPASVDVDGGALSYTATVLNDGPIDASGEVQWDFTGESLTFATGQLPTDCAADSTAEGGAITCPFTALSPGEELALAVDVSSDTAGDVFSRVEVTTETQDSVPADNTATQAAHFTEIPNGEDSQELGEDSVTLAVGDVNGDGLDDLVVATRAGDQIRIWLNAGNGEMEPGQVVDDWNQTRRVLLADMDVDADLDLVLVSESGGRVYHNDGAGQFTLAHTLPVGDYSGATTADLDDDGDLDLVLLSSDGADYVYRNDGGGQFSQVASLEGGDSRAVVAADLDLDGYPDLAIARHDGPSVIYRNATLDDGDATSFAFVSIARIGTGGFTSVVYGDFTGDGFPDLAFGRDSDGIGSSQSKPGVEAAPVVKSHQSPSQFVPSNPVYANTGTGEFEHVASLGRAPTLALDAADIDGDGDDDLLAINATGAHQVYLSLGDGEFAVDAVTNVAGGMSEGRLVRLDDNSELDRVFAGSDRLGAAVFLSGDAEPLRPVDLSMALTTPESALLVGDSGTVTGEVVNAGDTVARDVELVVDVAEELTWDAAQLDSGECERDADDRIVCFIGSLAAGATAGFSVDASSSVEGTFDVGAELGSTNEELTPDDNSASAAVTVSLAVDQPDRDEGDGGGGALDWWLLLLMSAGLCHRLSGRR